MVARKSGKVDILLALGMIAGSAVWFPFPSPQVFAIFSVFQSLAFILVLHCSNIVSSDLKERRDGGVKMALALGTDVGAMLATRP